MAREILEVNPDNLTGKDCKEISKNPKLRDQYESKWGDSVTEICKMA